MLLPKIPSSIGFDTDNPEAFIRSCVNEDIVDVIDLVSLQGGEFEPEGYHLYMDNKIKHLCYINHNNELCIRQVPFIKRFVEDEINTQVEPRVQECFTALKQTYQDKGFEVILREGNTLTEILPGRTAVKTLGYEIIVTKGKNQNKYNSFVINLNNNLYELLSTSEMIVNWEAAFGDADTLSMMFLDNSIKIEKILRSDSTKIYILTYKDTGEIFQFASRSLVLGPVSQ